VHQVFFGVLLELVLGPEVLLRAQGAVIAVEAVDELLAVNVLLILRASVPVVDVPVHHKILLAIFLVQGDSLLSQHRDTLRSVLAYCPGFHPLVSVREVQPVKARHRV
jgi:hypothetical protein